MRLVLKSDERSDQHTVQSDQRRLSKRLKSIL
jgi:hypothetical protein